MKSGKLTSEQKMVFAVLESRMVNLVFKIHVNSSYVCMCFVEKLLHAVVQVFMLIRDRIHI